MRAAVIDIGTNSTRLLVAERRADELVEVHRESRVTRLGRGVDASGRLSAEAIADVSAVVETYATKARALGAEATEAIATSAVRDADNGDELLADLGRRLGVRARKLDGAEEARLTYLGASAGRTSRRPEAEVLVCDIGGGSTELVCGRGEQISFHTSLRCGVVRQSERHLRSDPPERGELRRLEREVGELIAAGLSADWRGRGPIDGIAVAGTPTSLAAIELELDPYDPKQVHGHVLELEAIQRTCARLAALPLAERERVVGLQPGRAPTIVCGIVIVIEVMRAAGLERIEVSERDILHGAAAEVLAATAEPEE